MEALLQLMQTVSTKFGIFSGVVNQSQEHPGTLILGARASLEKFLCVLLSEIN